MSMRPVRAALAILLGLAGSAIAGMPAVADTQTDPPIRVTVIAPLVVPAGTTGLISADELTQFTSPGGVLSRELDALINRPIAIGIDPMILASIRVLGNAAPPTATAWLDRLANATNETFPLAYGDSDITLQFEAGAQTVLGPQSFDFALVAKNFLPVVTPNPTDQPTPIPTSTARPEGGLRPYPTTDSLVAWPYTTTSIAWPVEGTVAVASLGKLDASGFHTTIVSSRNVAVANRAGNAAAMSGAHSVLVSDETVSSLMREATVAPTLEIWSDAVSRLTAAIGGARAAANGQRRSIVVTVGRDVPRIGSRLAQTVDAIASIPTVAIDPLRTAIAAPPSAVTIDDANHAPGPVAQIANVTAAERAEEQFATVLDSPEQLTAERRLHVLALFSAQWIADPIDWQTGLDRFVQESVAVRNSVQVAESSTINLLTNLKPLPVNVNNESPYPITVYIAVRPETAQLKVESSRVKLSIPANSQGKGEIPVQAITNGTVLLDVSLSSGTGVAVGHNTTIELNVQASWETPITVGLAALVVLFFAFGIVRTVLRRRKAASE